MQWVFEHIEVVMGRISHVESFPGAFFFFCLSALQQHHPVLRNTMQGDRKGQRKHERRVSGLCKEERVSHENVWGERPRNTNCSLSDVLCCTDWILVVRYVEPGTPASSWRERENGRAGVVQWGCFRLPWALSPATVKLFEMLF